MSIWDNHDVGEGMTEEAAAALPPGARVRHYIFGDGVIEYRASNVEGYEKGIGIRFDRHGLKELMPCFACARLMVLPPLDITNP